MKELELLKDQLDEKHDVDVSQQEDPMNGIVKIV